RPSFQRAASFERPRRASSASRPGEDAAWCCDDSPRRRRGHELHRVAPRRGRPLYLSRRPAEPEVGPRTLELGPQPPAVVNFLVNDFRVADDAVPATLVDLAARNVVDVEWRGPTSTFGRRSGEPASRT